VYERDGVLLEQLRDPAPLLGGVELPKAPASELIGGMLQAAREATTLVWVKDSSNRRGSSFATVTLFTNELAAFHVSGN
jgi:hypothetical protein